MSVKAQFLGADDRALPMHGLDLWGEMVRTASALNQSTVKQSAASSMWGNEGRLAWVSCEYGRGGNNRRHYQLNIELPVASDIAHDLCHLVTFTADL
jgi:hypothetical protein